MHVEEALLNDERHAKFSGDISRKYTTEKISGVLHNHYTYLVLQLTSDAYNTACVNLRRVLNDRFGAESTPFPIKPGQSLSEYIGIGDCYSKGKYYTV